MALTDLFNIEKNIKNNVPTHTCTCGREHITVMQTILCLYCGRTVKKNTD